MPNDNMFWVLVAPGLTSCVCFFVESFPAVWSRSVAVIGRFGARMW